MFYLGKKAIKSIGVDWAIFYTILSRIIQAGGGVLTIIFIAKYLNKEEQGYYFTFGSILAIQIFFELGLSSIITQFVAHEMAHLHWENGTQLIGADIPRSRLASLLHFCIKWFAVIAALLIVTLLIAGYFFFNKYSGNANSGGNWRTPWCILSFSTACALLSSPLFAFLEGLGKVKEVAKIRLLQQLIQLSILFGGLMWGLKLLASPIAALTSLMVAISIVIFSSNGKILKVIWHQKAMWQINYKTEIFPYQWKIALSWISGYFIYQLFNPILFAIDGPVVAGQMGMTLAALNGVLGISLSWINTKVPLFSNLIAKRDFLNLDRIFNTTLKQSCLMCIFGLGIFISTIYILRYIGSPIGGRFLPLLPLILLCITTFVNQFIASIATYLRCHKQEPFLIQSIVLGVLTAISTFVFGNLFGVNGITIGYCSIMVFVSLTWSLHIFKRKKALWH